ncbi:Protein kinase domain,Protein kinase-like domain,Serine/threonine-protein kinase, active site [Cinara cedri]|uniref:Protein kinase domain,Protein kinase-like domain,Serine/threonine-protein kinase, active site n=1 Tax=Cinara cedri TaxID=506608 RepID=A0A5E4NLE0_9HEMI|nr:Protein kinase domain,Protein kinase-like domain,Serine/threonine-protein kinase, active site [Cinara cedri]
MLFFHKKDHKVGTQLSKTNTLKSEGYIILDHISTGGYGEVHHAKYIQDDKELNLVVKIIDTNLSSKEYVSKFLPRELDVIRKINHPYIVHTHSILQKKAILFVFMTYAEKGDLFDYITTNGPIKEDQARIWFRQVALAVQYLHTVDIVHRDIKCENILITKNFTVKLSDFSFSKFIKRAQRLNCNTHCCSVWYAPPEVLSLRPYDGKSSDIWSLGVVLYIMIYAKMPFSKNDTKRMYQQQVKREWCHHPSIGNLISENLKTCVDNILQPEPRKRWVINNILESDWITMNLGLVKMNEQESMALIEAQNLHKLDNQKHLKKIEAKRSGTQQILNKQLPRFFSEVQKMELKSNMSKKYSKGVLKRPSHYSISHLLETTNLMKR